MPDNEAQSIPEVQICFFGIRSIQGSATHMVDCTLTLIINLMACTVEFPTQVNLFHMGKEIFIKAIHLFIERTANDKASTGSPKDRPCIIVLAVVFFNLIENAPPAK